MLTAIIPAIRTAAPIVINVAGKTVVTGNLILTGVYAGIALTHATRATVMLAASGVRSLKARHQARRDAIVDRILHKELMAHDWVI